MDKGSVEQRSYLLLVCIHLLIYTLPHNVSGLLPPPVTSSEATSGTDNDGANGPNSHQRFREVLPSGVLLVEPYCWKDIVLKPPVLSMTTTAVQTAILSLPPGSVIIKLSNSMHSYYYNVTE